jgi:hypothetical protein
VDSGGGSDSGGENAAQIEQRYGVAKCEDNEAWCVMSSVDSPSTLKYLGGTSINIWCAIEEGPVLLGRGIEPVVLVTCSRTLGAREITCERYDGFDRAARQQPFTRAQRSGVAVQL